MWEFAIQLNCCSPFPHIETAKSTYLLADWKILAGSNFAIHKQAYWKPPVVLDIAFPFPLFAPSFLAEWKYQLYSEPVGCFIPHTPCDSTPHWSLSLQTGRVQIKQSRMSTHDLLGVFVSNIECSIKSVTNGIRQHSDFFLSFCVVPSGCMILHLHNTIMGTFG